MFSPERYRAHARECMDLAELAPDMIGRQFFSQLARVWDEMANRAEQAAQLQEFPSAPSLDVKGSDS